MAENSNAFQAEIKELEAKLEAKKREMVAAGTETPEKHVFKQVVREHTGHEAPSSSFNPHGSASASNPSPATKTTSPQDDEKLDQLVTHAFTKGIISAVSEARKLNVPFLVDMLHDRLVDEYYQKLLDARKLNIE